MKEIVLTQGKVAIVDDEDFEELNKYKWHAYRGKNKNIWYAYHIKPITTTNNRRQTILMHRLIIDAPKGVQVDHKDGSGLNNQKENLRLATTAENCCNTPLHRDSTSGYKGVTWAKNSQKWNAQIQYKGKKINLGYFLLKTEAAIAYNTAALEYFGDFARLNFSVGPNL